MDSRGESGSAGSARASLDPTITAEDCEEFGLLPGLERALEALRIWQNDSSRGAFFLAGEVGMGETAWLDRFAELATGEPERLILEERLLCEQSLRCWLAERLLAVGGTAAVAIGFALKDLAASVLAGVIILLDRPFQVGDRVTFGGYYGEVRHIGLRSVRLMTLGDTRVTLPNNMILNQAVASANAGAVDMMVQVDLYMGLGQDLAEAKRIVNEAVLTSRFVNLERTWAVAVSQETFATYAAVCLRTKAYVLDFSGDNHRHRSALQCAVGEVVSLDDERFVLEDASAGLWQPMTQMTGQGAGLYFLEPHNPDRIPVLFVHGIGGTPLDSRVLIERLDKTKFEPWIFFYPSGFRLTTIIKGLRKRLVPLCDELGVESIPRDSRRFAAALSRA